MPGELPKGDKAVYVFLEMIALGFALGSVDSLMSGKPWYVTTGSLVLGIACFLAGIKWAKIKQKLLVGYINPVEWLAHARLHPYIGGTIIVVLFAALSLALWVRGAKKTVSPVPKVHHAEITMPMGGWMTEWGSKPPNIAYAVTNVAPIVPYGSHFRLMFNLSRSG